MLLPKRSETKLNPSETKYKQRKIKLSRSKTKNKSSKISLLDINLRYNKSIFFKINKATRRNTANTLTHKKSLQLQGFIYVLNL
jgi:hypothetical protein